MTRSLARTLLSLPALVFWAHAALAQGMAVDLAQTVVKKQLAQGVSMDDAVDSMKLRANQLNMKLVAELPLSKQIEAMGQKSRRMEIFQFCDPLIAKQMVEYDMNFAAYLPCRITLVEDKDGHGWLVMMNLDIFLQGGHLPPELKKLGTEVRDKLSSIMDAGAKGEL
jgi:uncharacterized protein (DUF302 family)